MLLQAKKVSVFPANPDNENQHHLYATWPPFEYVRSTKLNGKKRHITGVDLYDASRYLLIEDQANRCFQNPSCLCSFRPCCCHLMTASPARPTLSHYRCFLCEFVNFLLGNAGKVFTSPPPGRTRNWDRVINDLITMTAERRSVFVSRAAASNKDKRGQGLDFSFLSGDLSATYGKLHALFGKESHQPEKNIDEPPTVHEKRSIEDGENGGISMIEFIVSNDERSA